jgi:outer membrane protein OmpA-like peptidoglycan-associated protein
VPRRVRLRWLAVGISAVALGVSGFVVLGDGDGSRLATASPNAGAPVGPGPSSAPAHEPTGSSPVTSEPEAGTHGASSSTTRAQATSPSVIAGPGSGPDAASAGGRGVEITPHFAVYADGVLHMQGAVRDRATADALIAKAAAVVGPANVIDEYVIDPRAPLTSDGHVRVDDAVLFDSGSTRISAEFAEVVDLAVLALTLNPQATLVIEGHTDSLGTERSNLRLSQRRADSIVRYMVAHGIDRSRLTAVGKGETEPVADNATPEGMARNRRIQVTFFGLLD